MSFENLEVRRTTINGEDWSLTPFNTGTGLSYLRKIFKLCGGSVASLITTLSEEDGLSRAINTLVDNIDKEDVILLIKDLVFAAKCNNQKVDFDIYYAARYDILLAVVTFVVTENYKSVFPKGSIKE